jgi:hypothetical protein
LKTSDLPNSGAGIADILVDILALISSNASVPILARLGAQNEAVETLVAVTDAD